MELGQVIGVLLDPPPFGRALVRLEDHHEVQVVQVAWLAERAMSAGKWGWVSGPDAELFDGSMHRWYHGDRLVEEHEGRPERWHPNLHPFFPLKGGYWGRPQDEWRMRDHVTESGQRAVVSLVHLGGDSAAELTIDLVDGYVARFERTGHKLEVLDVLIRPPELRFDRPWLRVTDSAFLDDVRPQSPRPGTTRWAG